MWICCYYIKPSPTRKIRRPVLNKPFRVCSVSTLCCRRTVSRTWSQYEILKYFEAALHGQAFIAVLKNKLNVTPTSFFFTASDFYWAKFQTYGAASHYRVTLSDDVCIYSGTCLSQSGMHVTACQPVHAVSFASAVGGLGAQVVLNDTELIKCIVLTRGSWI